ncbi:hypothetical protein OQ523_17025, partial [Phocaeicola vulgatus]|nr:hypothetical protein [Phocaeicola vulgatus]
MILPYNRISYKAEEFLLYDISDSATNYYLVALFYFTLLLMACLKKKGSPDKSGGKFFNSIENLHLCTMNNQGLLALAQLILPSEILSN